MHSTYTGCHKKKNINSVRMQSANVVPTYVCASLNDVCIYVYAYICIQLRTYNTSTYFVTHTFGLWINLHFSGVLGAVSQVSGHPQ